MYEVFVPRVRLFFAPVYCSPLSHFIILVTSPLPVFSTLQPNQNAANPRSILKGGPQYEDKRATAIQKLKQNALSEQQQQQQQQQAAAQAAQGDDGSLRKKQQKSDPYYLVYSPDDDFSSDEEGDHGGGEDDEDGDGNVSKFTISHYDQGRMYAALNLAYLEH